MIIAYSSTVGVGNVAKCLRRPPPSCAMFGISDVRRDEIDYLPENGVYCLRCFWWCLVFHDPVGYRKSLPSATLNFHPFANAVSEWDANEFEWRMTDEYGKFEKAD